MEEPQHNYNQSGELQQADETSHPSPATPLKPISDNAISKPANAKLIKRRYQEFRRHRRDLLARYSESLVSCDEDIAYFRHCADEISKLRHMLQEKLAEIEELGEHEDNLATDSAALAEANRTIENYRLELIRRNARIQKLTERHNSSKNSSSGDIVHEITSLSFRQLFRLGTALTLPLIIAFLAGALVIALTILFSMGIWW